MADTAAASVASAMTSAAVAASSAATAGLDSSGNHILTQILISGIVDLWLFTVDILVCCGSILRFVLMQVHRCIDQSDRPTRIQGANVIGMLSWLSSMVRVT